MTRQEFKKIGKKIWWDGRGWQRAAALDLGVCTQTVSNWCQGTNSLPCWVELVIEKKLQK